MTFEPWLKTQADRYDQTNIDKGKHPARLFDCLPPSCDASAGDLVALVRTIAQEEQQAASARTLDWVWGLLIMVIVLMALIIAIATFSAVHKNSNTKS
jgi:hypothetical protein